mgnify:CR=1 FL=1
MNKFTNKSWFLGIDISKKSIDVALFSQSDVKQFEDKAFDNSLKGFDKMHSWLKRKKVPLTDILVCMEHTGTYGLLLFSWLTEKEIDFCVEPGLQIRKSLGIVRGKNDKVDARRIAKYAFQHKDSIKPYVLPAKNLLQIKQLLTYRDQLVRIRSGLKTSLKNHQEYQQINQLDYVTRDIEQQIRHFNEKIDYLEDQLLQVINNDEQLKKNFDIARSVGGIGLIISAYMLVTTNNYTSFKDGRKYACYSGIAPFEHSSGSSIKGRTSVSNMANKRIKALFSNGANVAYKYDPELKAYYKRKREEGKDHKLIINAISCKLINRVFAVVKRQSNYVSLYQQNFS